MNLSGKNNDNDVSKSDKGMKELVDTLSDPETDLEAFIVCIDTFLSENLKMLEKAEECKPFFSIINTFDGNILLNKFSEELDKIRDKISNLYNDLMKKPNLNEEKRLWLEMNKERFFNS